MSLKSFFGRLSFRRRRARRAFEQSIDEAASIVSTADESPDRSKRLHETLLAALKHGADAFSPTSAELAAPLYALAAHELSQDRLADAHTHATELVVIAEAAPLAMKEPSMVAVRALAAAVASRQDPTGTRTKVAIEAWAREAETAGDAESAGAAWNQLALLVARAGDRGIASSLFEKAKRHRRAAHGEKGVATLETLFNAATYRSDVLSLDDAEADLRVVVRELEHRPESTVLRSSALHNLAVLREERGDLDEAKVLFARALEALEKAHGQKHARLRPTLVRLALLHHREGSLLLAMEAYDRAYEIATKELGSQHPIAIAIEAWKTELSEGVGPGALARGLA